MNKYFNVCTASFALLLGACGPQGERADANAGASAGAESEAANDATSGNASADGNLSAAGGENSIPCPFSKNNRKWAAWVNKMPGSTHSLIVTGEVSAQANYTGKLTAGGLDKMNPPNQHFELNLIEQDKAPGGWREIRGEVKPANPSGYTRVIIRCHGEQLASIPVKTVS